MSGSYGAPRRAILIFTVLILLLSGCSLPIPPVVKTPEARATAATTPLAVATSPSSAPLRTLTVCLGEEPNTLYPFAGPNDAARRSRGVRRAGESRVTPNRRREQAAASRPRPR